MTEEELMMINKLKEAIKYNEYLKLSPMQIVGALETIKSAVLHEQFTQGNKTNKKVKK